MHTLCDKLIGHRSSSTDQFPEHIVQDASILEVLDLHISIQSKLNFEFLARVGLDCDQLVHFYFLGQLDGELLIAFQFYA